MKLETRVNKAEAVTRPKRTVYFIIENGRASGWYWWTTDSTVKWKDLTKAEFDDVTAKLQQDGAEIIAINITSVYPDGREYDGWTEREQLTPEQLIEIYDNNKAKSERGNWSMAVAKRKPKRKSFMEVKSEDES